MSHQSVPHAALWQPAPLQMHERLSSVLVLDEDWQSAARVAEALQGVMQVTQDVGAQGIGVMIADPAAYPLLDIKRLQRAMPEVPLILCTTERRSARLFEWFALLRIERTLQKPASAEQIETACRLVTGQTHFHQMHRALNEALLGVLAQVPQMPKDWPHPAGVFRDMKALLEGRYFHGASMTRLDRLVVPVLKRHADLLRDSDLCFDAAIETPDIFCDLPLSRQMLSCMLVEGQRVARFSGDLRLHVDAGENSRRVRVTAYGKRTRQPPRWPLVETFLQAAARAHGGQYTGVYQGAHLHQQLDLPFTPAGASACEA